VRAKVASTRPPTPAQKRRAKLEKTGLSGVRTLLRAAGIERPQLDVRGETVMVTLPFALIERLTRK
jgi:hypothetical protein